MHFTVKAHKYILLIAIVLASTISFSQNNKQKELETRRQELRNEIEQLNKLRADNKNKQKSQLSLVEGVNHKISVLSNLIKVTNQQANLLTREINSNQKKITDLRKELTDLKDDYAAMVVKAYKSKNKQSKIMFLLSSNNFKQAYKRLQYIQQYADHQKKQGENIKAKTLELQATNKKLLDQQKEKNSLITENRQVQKTLQEDRKEHEALMKSIQKNLSAYTAQIRQKEREVNRIDAEIKNIIRAAIAKSNTKAGKKSTSTGFALTPEEKVLASNFTSNKGKLPWPVDNGYVSLGYGSQRHPINKSLTIQSNGVRITTERGAKVRAVFNGKVMSVRRIKNANPLVMIQHGNYITVYKNLSKVYVKEGDIVKTKQFIGEVAVDVYSGETILSFIISKGVNTQNPASWIYKM
ncbi:murein hydrolase activator EnvC family protein [Neotamlana laminarinivorans]|uniref:Peptidoglycan DD-metalloendopeptidase family protein n=1 Tax=Neotamlana laminarinivorans TaxID=2883124 RepID=A0A9X1I169_9FLAO|nr:peptidoglycan DD-metalloendopeptidase family protein [Tamlana laminarinivorans]MCB4798367.1 peptidoglycan DD-metalloendopeptidase family protein [Tamlana laminarinivorans]